MSDSTPPMPPEDDINDVAFGLRNIEPAIDCFRLYMEALTYCLLKIPRYASLDPRTLFSLPDIKKLSDHDALRLFLSVWRTSSFISDQAFIRAGMTPGRCLPRFNANSLGLADRGNHHIPKELKKVIKDDRFTTNAKRIIESAVEVGLLTRDPDDPRCQDVEATRMLHDMLMRYSRNYTALQLRLAGLLLAMKKED